ncbi:hypothetical protein [Paraeggerthella hongkongensis]|uniref:DUF3574 domain-containing protein n=1 Tax=Paraeggerthella hongkongensis TaxID=230658 RepID=A0A3N0B9A8_9ACTN|nr:hypothetical protein [Paraeggerthella hongkongensis]RNL43880.1 hypothetical protein DMP08_07305 [Paraeggerthella hongkongensis]
MKEKTFGKLCACACATALAVSVMAGCTGAQEASQEPPSLVNGVTDQQEIVYCLYFGLYDKDAGKQVLTMDEAKDILIPLFVEAGSGYTVYEAEGGYAAEDGAIIQNDTLVFDSVHGSDQAVIGLIEKAKAALNVESVYCESKAVGYKMYGGVMSAVE